MTERKGVARGELSPESKGPLFIGSFSSLSSCLADNFTILIHSQCSQSLIFWTQQATFFFFTEKALKKPLFTTCSTPKSKEAQ